MFCLPFLALTVAATAQTVPGEDREALSPPVVAERSSECQLHIYPAPKMISHLRGWLHAGLMNGGEKGRKSYPIIPPGTLAPEEQKRLIGQLDIAALFGASKARVVFHDAALSPLDVKNSDTRNAAAMTDCYSEFVISQLSHDVDALAGKSLNITGRYFWKPNAETPGKSFTTLSGAGLKLFPVTDAKDNPAASAELEAVFKSIIIEFSTALDKFRNQPDKSGKKK